jgi:hypothetical protein
MEDSMIRIMLKDEYDRTLRMIEIYRDELQKYPIGSPVIRKHSNNSYMYLAYRDNGKVINKYIGNINSEKVKKLEKDLMKRKYLSDVLSKMEFERKEIEICLKASEKLYIGKNNVKNNKEKLNTPVLKNNIVINDLQTAMQIKYNKELFREKIREKIKNKA